MTVSPDPHLLRGCRPSETQWSAIARRDSAADDRFVYGVTTTGIYCRPSCPARRPRPVHVRVFGRGDAARAAGFRPCRRCRPDEPATPAGADIVIAACRRLADVDATPSLAALAEAAGLSTSHFHRLFKAATGLTPRQYAAAHRDERLRAALATGAPVTTALFDAGYNAVSRFYERADDVLGMSATRYRKGGENQTIRFAIGACSLGAILVAATDLGVCAILLGDDPEPLLADLERRFPAARLVGADAGFERWVAAVVGFVEAPAVGLELPLDIRGTAFQQRVWRALRDIPPGSTATYAEIAARLGQPSAVRAVAGACAANALAVAIPCHRVIRGDGALSGYRWGVVRKQALLDREQGR